ncbi:thioredoxin domain-containing protein [Modestobacter muralis]|uniref:Thioredoxin domain-containing protein n=1 Tax=Modestobacter muralis TaxID=1608614 RepID=A0A6P0H8I8_9ACTN|nr:thioredoxin domain-containing protein [Modestobacter muralis]NEN51116.1 thioredoxin domain-containing protein [Modestobacter muralis]
MSSPTPSPAGHTPEGGVLVGSDGARRKLVVFEDPQCPFCRQFEDATGDLLRREISSGSVSVEYRMRSFLGPESVRANNALALAAEAGHFDQLRRELFAHQPAEQTGGFTTDELVELGRRAGLTGPEFVSGVQQGRHADWVVEREEAFLAQDPDGTPQAQLDGEWVDAQVLYDPEALGALVRG